MTRGLAFAALLALLALSVAVRADPPAETAPATAAPDAAQPPAAPASPADTSPAAPEQGKAEPAKPEERLENLEQIDAGTAIAILGKKVRDAGGKDMGLVVDVLVDRDANVRAAVIDFGGFLGVGSRKIAIDWHLLQFDPADRDAPIVLSLDRAEVQEAPEYKPATPPGRIVIVGPQPAMGTSVPPGGQ
jgi:PRC-barrel domain